MGIFQKAVRTLFMEKYEPSGEELTRAKCEKMMKEHQPGTPEYKAAWEQYKEVENMGLVKEKTRTQNRKIDPAIIAAGIAGIAQLACTIAIEHFNSNGNYFPTKNITSSWLGNGGIWSRIGGFLTGKKKE